jgi:hypothetical protein
MDRDTLLEVCERFARERDRIVLGRVTIDVCGPLADPTAEILRCFRRAEISESEKNALLSLVADPDDDDFDVSEFAAGEFDAGVEMATVRDSCADARPDL